LLLFDIEKLEISDENSSLSVLHFYNAVQILTNCVQDGPEVLLAAKQVKHSES
jgi:hypothetical protein